MANKNNQNGQRNEMKTIMANVSRLVKEIAKHRGRLTVVLLATVLSTAFAILGPRELGKATSEVFAGVSRMASGTGGIDYSAVGQILLRTFLIYLVSSIFSAVQGYQMNTITETVSYDLRRRMQDKVNNMPMSYFESRPHGEVLSRIVNDIDTIAGSLAQSATRCLDSIATMIGIAIIMFTMNKTMALIVYLLVPIALIFVSLTTRYSQKYFRSQQSVLGKLNAHVEEAYTGQQIIKSFNRQDESIDRFGRTSALLAESGQKGQFFSSILFPVMTFVSNVGYVLVVIVGGYLSIIGQIQVGIIQAFTQYVNRFTQPITDLTQVLTMAQSMSAASERVFEFLDEEEEDQHVGETLHVPSIVGKVEFDHVKFGYNPDEPVIKDFSATIRPSQKVAIVGPTGAGKSTIVKLLMRFYDIDSGEIRLDNKPITDYSRSSYQQAIAMVLQDTWLFEGSVRDNIRYGRLDATDEEVEETAKAARCHNFIMQLPGGYDFVLQENGANISQGQAQLMTIARAMLANRPILILDEATSSVDTRTEILIQEAMDKLMEGRTSFVIAHRLSTILDSDVILYLEDGDVVEQGTHEELLELNGRYAKLYRSQFAGS